MPSFFARIIVGRVKVAGGPEVGKMESSYRYLIHRVEEGIAVLTFTEPLLNADAVHEARTAIDASDVQKVVLDCQSVRFLVSGSLYPDQEPFRPLLQLRKQLADQGGQLILCSVETAFEEVLRITRLNRIFEIQPDVDTAISSMRE